VSVIRFGISGDALRTTSTLGNSPFSSAATRPPYIVAFSLDTTGSSRHNPRQRSSFTQSGDCARVSIRVRLTFSGGNSHAIFARLHCAVYQSAMRRSRPLVTRRRWRSDQPRWPLPGLRRHVAQRAPAAGPAFPHAPAVARFLSPAAPAALARSSRHSTFFLSSLLAWP
jgi:hypothetical protein